MCFQGYDTAISSRHQGSGTVNSFHFLIMKHTSPEMFSRWAVGPRTLFQRVSHDAKTGKGYDKLNITKFQVPSIELAFCIRFVPKEVHLLLKLLLHSRVCNPR